MADLKESNSASWHSKLKRMSGQEADKIGSIAIEALEDLDIKEQAEVIADHYSQIANEYDPIDKNDFLNFKGPFVPPVIYPMKVNEVILSLNKKAATVPGDIPIKLFQEFSVELSTPLAHIYNCCLEQGIYPDVFKFESVTPAPKKNPPRELADLRKISGLINSAKVFDKILAEYIISDMKPTRDSAQFGNEKDVSIQHI